MIELVQDICSFLGLVTGVVYFYDRMAKDRPIASLTITKQGTRKIACIRVGNVSDYDIAILDATVTPVVYFLTEDLETRSLIEGAAGSRPYFMLKPREEKEFVFAPHFKGGVAVEVVGDQRVAFRLSWRRGNAIRLPHPGVHSDQDFND
jgi:hypothetical protein